MTDQEIVFEKKFKLIHNAGRSVIAIGRTLIVQVILNILLLSTLMLEGFNPAGVGFLLAFINLLIAFILLIFLFECGNWLKKVSKY